MSKKPEEKSRSKIDDELKKRGWEKLHKNESGTGYKEEVYDKNGRPADYVLYIDSKPYAIIESKPDNKHLETQLQQARNYAKSLESDQKYNNLYNVPFIYSSDGEKTMIDDLRESTPTKRETESFYSPDDIKRKLKNRPKESINILKQTDYKDVDKKLWENQQNALKEIKNSIFNQDSKILVSMATGSGKTRTALALVYQLLDAGYINKVLFVPDTSELKRTAKSSFENYNPPGKKRFSDKYTVKDFKEYKEKKNNTDVVVSTIQKLSREINNNNKEYSSGEFDLIIADECHRGVYNKSGYGYALDFYDGIELGLTATPHEKTIERYNDNHVYSFDYQEALDNDLVVDFMPCKIKTKINMDGYKEYTPRQIGIDVIIEDTHRKVAEELLEYASIQDELTLVFAQNISHAENIVKIFRSIYNDKFENPKDAIKVASSKHRHSKKTLEDFGRGVDRNPKIVVTVNMVSTGVDIKPLKNLVFLRAVKSKILFNQMMGRGTRNYPNKKSFRVFDCLNILDYYDDTPPFNTEKVRRKRYKSTEGGDDEIPEDPETISKKDIDEIIDLEELYPIQEDLVSAEEYLECINTVIYDNIEEIKKEVKNCCSVEEANEKIENILTNEYEFYKSSYIISAKNNKMITNLFEYVHYLILMTPSIEQQANEAENQINKEFDLNKEQKKWISKINQRTIVENETISKEKLLKKPFSNMGGYDTAKKIFSDNPSLDDIIRIYNNNILSLELS